jgi:hypothetical protein
MVSMLKAVWSAWKGIAQIVGNFQARMILTLFYLIVSFPFALIIKASSDPLALKQKKPTWIERARHTVDLTDGRKQF